MIITNKTLKMLGLVLAGATMMAYAAEADINFSSINTLAPLPIITTVAATAAQASAGFSKEAAQELQKKITQAIRVNTSDWQSFCRAIAFIFNNRIIAATAAVIIALVAAYAANSLIPQKEDPWNWYDYANIANIMQNSTVPNIFIQGVFFIVVTLILYGIWKRGSNWIANSRLFINSDKTNLDVIKKFQEECAQGKNTLPQAIADLIASLPQGEKLTGARATQALATLQQLCSEYSA